MQKIRKFVGFTRLYDYKTGDNHIKYRDVGNKCSTLTNNRMHFTTPEDAEKYFERIGQTK